MPRPPILAYAEPELISSAFDNTSVHSNIDRLLLESEINVNYGKEYSYPEYKYGYVGWQETQPNVFNVDEPPPPKYYPWKRRIKTGEMETAVPINMQDYATIMEAADISDVSYPFHPKESNLFPEMSQKELIEKMRKGDAPGGMVAYSTGKGFQGADDYLGEYRYDKSKEPLLNLGLSKYYPPIYAGSPDAPDTVFINPSADEHTLFHEPIHWLTGAHPESASVSNRKMKAATREGFDIIESELFENAKKNMGEDLFNLYMSKMAAGERVTPMDIILLGSDIQIGKQQGGPAERKSPLAYMNPAVADTTAHSQMDKLLFEDEMSNIQPEGFPKMYNTDKESEQYFEDVGMPDKYRQGVLNLLNVSQNPVVEVHSPESLAKFFQGRGIPGATSEEVMANAPMTFYPGFEETVPDTIRYSVGERSPQYHASAIAAETSHGILERYPEIGKLFLEGIEPTSKMMDKILAGKSESKRTAVVQDIIEKNKKDKKPSESYDVEGYVHEGIEPFLMNYLRESASGYQGGGEAGEKESLLGKLKGFNIPNILGKIKRKNPEWTGEAGKLAGERGVSIRSYPKWMEKGLEKVSGRGVSDFVLGNTIFMGSGKKRTGTTLSEDEREQAIRWDIENELPHVQQFREEGLLGFLGKHAKDLLKHGAGEKTYDVPGTHESYHYQSPNERQRLMSELGYQQPQLASLQHGGPAERAPLLGYMNPAVQDETAHDSMDRIMFENELEQQPQHSMRTYQQGYDPAREWGEGMMPIGGAMKLLKGSKEWPDLLKVMAQSSRRDRYKMEAINNARNIFGKKIDAGGADAATKQYLESKWMEQVIK